MLFPTLQFAGFMLALLALLFAFRRSGPRKLLLLAASWVFYMAWNPLFIWLLLGVSLFDYWAGARLAALADARQRRAFLVLSLCANLGVLAWFKYSGWLASSLLWTLRAAGLEADWPLWQLTLPVGISFFTFQSLSYTIDVYRRRIPPAGSLLDYLLFVSFFPHLVAGPIIRAIDFLPQLRRPVQLRCDNQTVVLLCSGLVKKVVVADNLAPLVDAVLGAPAAHSSAAVWLAALCFSVQIYCDFSGYTEIAIGLGRLLGFWIPPNFDRPYFAASPSDFWRKWHISLSSWLRDYLYIPLGGSRGSELATLRNLMLTMLLGGLWHGASWNFVLWGAWHGLLLCAHRLYSRALAGAPGLARLGASWPGRLLSWVALQLGVLFGWLIFRLTEPHALQAGLARFLAFDGGMALGLPEHIDKVVTLAVLVCFALWHCMEFAIGIKRRLVHANAVWLYLYVAFCVMVLIILWPSQSAPFIYFQF